MSSSLWSEVSGRNTILVGMKRRSVEEKRRTDRQWEKNVELPLEGLDADGGNLDNDDCVLVIIIRFDAAIRC